MAAGTMRTTEYSDKYAAHATAKQTARRRPENMKTIMKNSECHV